MNSTNADLSVDSSGCFVGRFSLLERGMGRSVPLQEHTEANDFRMLK